jgi:hypothetical protein
MKRKAFSFLRSFYEAACNLSSNKDLQADFLMAVCNYGLNATEPEPGGELAALFALVKPNLDISFAKSVAGAKGGSRNKADESNPEADESELEAEGSRSEANESRNKADESNPEAIKDKGLRIKDKGVKQSLDLFDADFETFWKEYPRKTGKGAAKRAFEKALLKGATLESLVSAVRRQKCGSQWTRDGGQFIPHPATWLNQERWEDEVDGGIGNGNAGQYQENTGSKWNLQTDDLSD